MRIVGVGVDILIGTRFVEVLKRRSPARLAARILTDSEYQDFESLPSDKTAQWLANRWAIKEAVFKACSSQERLSWKQIEIYKDDDAPKARLIHDMHTKLHNDPDACDEHLPDIVTSKGSPIASISRASARAAERWPEALSRGNSRAQIRHQMFMPPLQGMLHFTHELPDAAPYSLETSLMRLALLTAFREHLYLPIMSSYRRQSVLVDDMFGLGLTFATASPSRAPDQGTPIHARFARQQAHAAQTIVQYDDQDESDAEQAADEPDESLYRDYYSPETLASVFDAPDSASIAETAATKLTFTGLAPARAQHTRAASTASKATYMTDVTMPYDHQGSITSRLKVDERTSRLSRPKSMLELAQLYAEPEDSRSHRLDQWIAASSQSIVKPRQEAQPDLPAAVSLKKAQSMMSLRPSEAAASESNLRRPPNTSHVQRHGTLLSTGTSPARHSKELGRILDPTSTPARSMSAQLPSLSASVTVHRPRPQAQLEQQVSKKARVELDFALESALIVEGGSVRGTMEIRTAKSANAADQVWLSRPKARIVGFEEISSPNVRHIIFQHTDSIASPDGADTLPCFDSEPDAEGFSRAKTGSFAFPFQMDLPVSSGAKGPSRNKQGLVRYIIIASIKLKSAASGTTRSIAHFYRHIEVYPYFHPSAILASSLKPIVATASKTLFMGGDGKVNVEASLHRPVWIAGQQCYVTVSVRNESSKKIKSLSLTLIRSNKLHRPASLTGDDVGRIQVVKKKLIESVLEMGKKAQRGEVTAKGSWLGVSSGETAQCTHSITIPPECLSISHGRYLEVAYSIKVAVAGSLSAEVSAELPVRIINFVSIDPPPGHHEAAKALERAVRPMSSESGSVPTSPTKRAVNLARLESGDSMPLSDLQIAYQQAMSRTDSAGTGKSDKIEAEVEAATPGRPRSLASKSSRQSLAGPSRSLRVDDRKREVDELDFILSASQATSQYYDEGTIDQFVSSLRRSDAEDAQVRAQANMPTPLPRLAVPAEAMPSMQRRGSATLGFALATPATPLRVSPDTGTRRVSRQLPQPPTDQSPRIVVRKASESVKPEIGQSQPRLRHHSSQGMLASASQPVRVRPSLSRESSAGSKSPGLESAPCSSNPSSSSMSSAQTPDSRHFALPTLTSDNLHSNAASRRSLSHAVSVGNLSAAARGFTDQPVRAKVKDFQPEAVNEFKMSRQPSLASTIDWSGQLTRARSMNFNAPLLRQPRQ
ncbi:uncharacterized protein L969DRAFT_102115 [Mixia osmundae IAM 14324]|uniref:Arrestin C-terminal-like domain-containing protein n=1 Tax=Mixia osmundae (strain CBS 9802 / IAM 14324 / JCM 22182 / KY 12970) TaxID=764103 RepID=G7E5W2_MIXOS|nr:uncharacterized protein L969DRAFT_102115 [Mixia osmundae IAM 14324]KEI40626.1 hypothetical protein L969DRAFT_102115 [Mixia osmundae IAM 14324]GAA98222.1 hypothetical protein E5Q_04905 [Mixia osmundae IAM 14324]